MSDVIIKAGKLHGEIRVPSSKSAAHRAVICSALAKGKSTLRRIDLSNDIKATLTGVKSLGADVTVNNGEIIIDGSNMFRVKNTDISCRESGSTARFLIPVAAAGGVTAEFTGEGKLPERPLSHLTSLLKEHGINCGDCLPLSVSGKLESGVFSLPGNISSQYITGLLFALPLLGGNSEIILTSPIESSGYINLTIKILNDFGIKIIKTENGYFVPGNQNYVSRDYTVEADWSQSAFFLAAGALGGNIKLKGLSPDSVQGDKEAFNLFKKFGADIRFENDNLICMPDKLHGINIDASQIPDLVPVLAVTAAFAEGETIIYNAERLRIKESDRLKSIAEGLLNLGADVIEMQNGLIIKGGAKLHGGKINGYNDHRIVMAFAVGAAALNDEVIITDAHSINKSYPKFFKDFKTLGGNANVVNMG